MRVVPVPVILGILLSNAAFAQEVNSCSHRVEIRVLPANRLEYRMMNRDPGEDREGGPDSRGYSGTTVLSWQVDGRRKKITVSCENSGVPSSRQIHFECEGCTRVPAALREEDDSRYLSIPVYDRNGSTRLNYCIHAGIRNGSFAQDSLKIRCTLTDW
jgi:hypothetical protein